jgi:peroxiredoxin
MKKMLKSILMLVLLTNCAIAQAQNYKNLTLSSPQVRQGQDLTISYSAGIAAGTEKELNLVASFYTSAKYPRPEIIKPNRDGANYSYKLHIPDSAKVLVIAFAKDTITDANNKKGYLFNVFNGTKAATDIPGIKSFIYTYGDEFAGVIPDQSLGLELVKQQLQEYPESKKRFDNIYYLCMAHSKNEHNKTLLKAELLELLKSNDESNWQKATNGFAYLKMNKAIDSVYTQELIKFPKGTLARDSEVRDIFFKKTGAEMETAYLDWMKRFPPSNFKENQLQYDYLRRAIARIYALEKDSVKALAYADSVKTPYYQGSAYNEIAGALFQANLYESAKLLYKKAIEIDNIYLTEKKMDEYAEKATSNYLGSCTNYAILLYQQKHYQEALKYVELAYALVKTSRDLNYYYAKILIANNREQDAYNVMDAIVKTGKATGDFLNDFKVLYIKIKGSDKGFDAYVSNAKNDVLAQNKKEMAKHMLDKTAPLFTLTDLDGKTVSLADLKDKVVILDFWATWCGPCKKSFPAMQMAVEKYKNDPGVKFLFIHTWETSKEPAEDAKAFIEGQKYNFHVLMDLKDPIAKKNKVVESYGVTAIPAKFVIGKGGKIRFQLTGFNGETADAVDELSTMIELAKGTDGM